MFSGGSCKEESFGEDLFSRGAFKDKSCGNDVFSGGAYKNRSCGKDVFSGGACKEKSRSGYCLAEVLSMIGHAFRVDESARDGPGDGQGTVSRRRDRYLC